MKLTHGEIRGLTALAVLLIVILLLIWFAKGCSGHDSYGNSEENDTVREFIAASDSVVTVADSVSDNYPRKKVRKINCKKHSAPPQPRRSPLDRGID